MTQTLNTFRDQLDSVFNAARPERREWGIAFLTDDEIDALRLAYLYRHNEHGCKVEFCPNIEQYLVTVFNASAKEAGIT